MTRPAVPQHTGPDQAGSPAARSALLPRIGFPLSEIDAFTSDYGRGKTCCASRGKIAATGGWRQPYIEGKGGTPIPSLLSSRCATCGKSQELSQVTKVVRSVSQTGN